MFFPADTACGAIGCWSFMTMDPATGLLVPDPSMPSFKPGCTVSATSCAAGTRRVTHFQVKVTYDERLRNHAYLIPPGLPTGDNNSYYALGPQATPIPWQDCGSNPACR
jgi:hypothetical protein